MEEDPNLVVNIFQGAQRTMKAMQKPILNESIADKIPPADPKTTIKRSMAILNKEPVQAISKFTRPNLDIFQVCRSLFEAASYSLIR